MLKNEHPIYFLCFNAKTTCIILLLRCEETGQVKLINISIIYLALKIIENYYSTFYQTKLESNLSPQNVCIKYKRVVEVSYHFIEKEIKQLCPLDLDIML